MDKEKPTKKEVLHSPLLGKGGVHGPTKKAKRKRDKDKLRKKGRDYE